MWAVTPRVGKHLEIPKYLARLCRYSSVSQREDLLSRIEVVEDSLRSAQICNKLMNTNEPRAIGMKITGAHNPKLVQIRSCTKKVYVFRTELNQDLFFRGELGSLLQSSAVLKVFHQSREQVQAVNNLGIKVWGIFDTAVAYAFLKYIDSGTRVDHPGAVSLNHLCHLYKLELGDSLVDYTKLLSQASLSKDTLYAAASSVEPLLDLHSILEQKLDSTFRPHYDEYIESILIESLDSELAKIKYSGGVKRGRNTLFLEGISKDINPALIYTKLAVFPGYKKVLVSRANRTAHINMGDRRKTLLAYEALSSSGVISEFGPQVKVKLVCPRATEDASSQKSADSITGNTITDESQVKRKMELLLKAEVPIYLEVEHGENNATATIFAGKEPECKFALTSDMIRQGGVGDLLSSRKVLKIVNLIKNSHAATLLKKALAFGYTPNNFVDLVSCYKMMLYWYGGQSFLRSPNPKYKGILNKYDLPKTLQGQYQLYFNLTRNLPDHLARHLREVSDIDMMIATHGDTSQSRQALKMLQAKSELNVVHVTCLQGDSENLASFIKTVLEASQLKLRQCQQMGESNVCLVEMMYTDEKARAIKLLHGEHKRAKLTLQALPIDLYHISEQIDKVLVAMTDKEMNAVVQPYVTRLDELGYFPPEKEPRFSIRKCFAE